MFLEFVRNISFIDVVFAFEDLKMPVTLCFEKISAPRCFMSKVCQFWKTFMQEHKYTFSANLLAAWSSGILLM